MAPPAPVAAAAKRTCVCFNWVHRAEFGYECFDTAAACESEHERSGFTERTTRAPTDEHPQCIKWGCKRSGECYRYGDSCSGTACPPPR